MTSLAKTDRFTVQHGHIVAVQAPAADLSAILTAIVGHDPLAWGDYDQVAFVTAPGGQMFRALGTGRNAATAGRVTMPCSELRVFTAATGANLTALVEAIYHVHPYEEPVIVITPCTRACQVRGTDEDNPNRFWNRDTPDWVPDEHRPD